MKMFIGTIEVMRNKVVDVTVTYINKDLNEDVDFNAYIDFTDMSVRLYLHEYDFDLTLFNNDEFKSSLIKALKESLDHEGINPLTFNQEDYFHFSQFSF